jgi:hypothetical protein
LFVYALCLFVRAFMHVCVLVCVCECVCVCVRACACVCVPAHDAFAGMGPAAHALRYRHAHADIRPWCSVLGSAIDRPGTYKYVSCVIVESAEGKVPLMRLLDISLHMGRLRVCVPTLVMFNTHTEGMMDKDMRRTPSVHKAL